MYDAFWAVVAATATTLVFQGWLHARKRVRDALVEQNGWGRHKQKCSICRYTYPGWFVSPSFTDCECGGGLKILDRCRFCRGKSSGGRPRYCESEVEFTERMKVEGEK